VYVFSPGKGKWLGKDIHTDVGMKPRSGNNTSRR
jgi:hypothetical protein